MQGRDPGDVQQQHGFTQKIPGFVDAQKNGLAIVGAGSADFALKHDMEQTGPLAFSRQGCTNRRINNFTGLQTTDLLGGELRK